jgi:glyoxylase-like metal-dependent hydrolase (beta-lactamase superfamily II)
MIRMRRATTLLGVCILAAVTRPSAQEPDRLKAAVDGIGANTIKRLHVSAIGAIYSVGQSPSPAEPWPRVTLKSYDATINYETASMRVELVRTQGAVPPRGGGVPFTGEQRQIQFVSGSDAWDVPSPPPAGRGGAATASATAPASDPQPQPASVIERRQQIYLTPHGFLKAAMANQATVKTVPAGTEVSFAISGLSTFTGILNSKNQVEHVQTWIDNPVLGDMLVEATYTDYETAGNLTFPMHIVQKQGGHLSLEISVSNIQSNVPVDITVPAAVRGAALPPVRVEAQRIAEGVYYLTGGSHHSVAIDMGDHIVLVEAPLDEGRSLAVIAKVKDTIPGKPIRAVVNTHHHFDHAGGLRTFVDEGAAIVTHEINQPYYATAWAMPRTLHPDRLARSGKQATFRTFTEKDVLKGTNNRTIEVHRIADSPHHDGFAMVYLPADRILIEADAYTPAAEAPPAPGSPPATAAATAPPPPQAVSPTTVNLYENIRRLKLDVERIAALHGPRLATMADLAKAIGRTEP